MLSIAAAIWSVDAAVLEAAIAASDRIQRREGVAPVADPRPGREPGPAAKVPCAVLEDDAFLRVAMSRRVVALIPHLVVYPRLKSTWLQYNGWDRGIAFHANHTPHDPVDCYGFQQRICANLVTVMYAFHDIDEDGGALQVLPGSHKANYPLPEDPGLLAELRVASPLRKGQALIFSHDLNHGSHNRRNVVRRSLFTSFSPGSSAHTQGDNDLYDGLFARSVEGSWQQYLLRRPRGDRDTHPQPGHPVAEDTHLGVLRPIADGEPTP